MKLAITHHCNAFFNLITNTTLQGLSQKCTKGYFAQRHFCTTSILQKGSLLHRLKILKLLILHFFTNTITPNPRAVIFFFFYVLFIIYFIKLVRTLYHWACMICSPETLQTEREKINEVLVGNGYPSELIRRVIKSHNDNL